ncbi:prepilin-type N-terminal cleavage/methylation domain-containing protein [Leeia sp. TBRC 13508]|uniref:Prepilin-type N-terminal cleavage/methylation domain-containing protein n=1 Tax=Leeia speluncae TaxID=2884804 RepID=A0ABS8D649_9NEIS|nr:prepilin-type N-terminal cleavage/methylation domain-containing protein [Leeia speluncae]MCB6183685.1 prepilin-type N-terminal cleavage/methylation domain-containing protein [Leeia speluncae]
MRPNLNQKQIGFSLFELSIVLLVLSILLSAYLRYESVANKDRYLRQTERILQNAKSSLLDYVALNGALPCPASATSHGQPAVTADGKCLQPYDGYFPAAFLGVSGVDEEGYLPDALDSVHHRIRYAVSINGFSTISSCSSSPSTQKSGLWTSPISAPDNLRTNFYLSNPITPELCVCSTASCSPSSTWLANGVVAIVYSLGRNVNEHPIGVDELQNAKKDKGARNRIFVMHGPSETSDQFFDDSLIWISAPEIYGQMLKANKI